NSGGSSVAYLNITVNDVAPGAFEYIPENNIITNNSLVHIEPSFINTADGNGSSWGVASGIYYPGDIFDIVVGDTIYFSANNGGNNQELFAYNTLNASMWLVAEINPSLTQGSLLAASMGSSPMVLRVGDTLYFNANDGVKGSEIWAHDTSNHSTWRVTDINSGSGSSNPGLRMMKSIGTTLYFDAYEGSEGTELWAHDTSNGSTWRVTAINGGLADSAVGRYMAYVVGDVLYFSANDGITGHEVWAHDTSNLSTWRVADIFNGASSSNPGTNQLFVGDTIFFDANDGVTGRELWAHDTSNHTTWKVIDLNSGSSNPGQHLFTSVGTTVYFSADDGITGNELWAYDTSNLSTWQVIDINGASSSNPGNYMHHIVRDIVYFSANDGNSGIELWAYDTSNFSTWQVTDINGASSSNPGMYMSLKVGDSLYFSASDGSTGTELWAHDTSNLSTWKAADFTNVIQGGTPGQYMHNLVDDTLYFSVNNPSSGIHAYQPAQINVQTNTGGAVTTWAINASLPSGLTFGANNGTIYGTPTELWSQTSYLVWGNDSVGSKFAYINITIIDQVPVLSYSPENFILTKGQSSSDLPLVPTLTGPGLITSWEINGSLPSGLNFGTSNGTIWGIPTVLQTSPVTYTVWANNSGGSTSATINITINDQPPFISYSPDELVFTKGVTISSTISPISSGGTPTSYMISPSLLNTFQFNPSTGLISGTPSVLLNRTMFTITASNSGGSSVTYINVTIVDQVPSLSYSPENLTLTKGLLSSDLPLSATVTGSGTITSWEINGSLPAGLNFGTSNGTLWGTPTVLQVSPVTYTVWANNSGGSTSATINITILDEVPILSYAPENLTLTNNEVNSDLPLAPTLTGPGVITSWEVNGSLPSGLFFGTSNGTFWGTPTVLQISPVTYTVWANNSGGSTSATINITIIDEVPILSYSPENLTLTNNTESIDLPLAPTLTGPGTITSWEMEGSLPTGLFFGTSNGSFWGTPAALQTSPVTYTVWANNSGGSTSATINITVVDEVPVLSYSPENLTLTNNTMSIDLPLLPNLAGPGAITSWELNGSLPAGLHFGTSNGTFWGTPTVLQISPVTYTVWANNSGGSTSASINITIVDEVPVLSYSPENLTLSNNTVSSELPLVATLTGPGIITSWELNGSLPAGLHFGTSNGTFWGTPTVLQVSPVTYTVWANNSGGSTSATINITIIDELPILSYSPENLTLTNNTVSVDLPLLPTLSGPGVITSWELNGSLPDGLNFGTSNGTFWGTPTVLQIIPVTYTVWANNSGGSTSATINITIVDQVPILSYSPENLTLYNNTVSSFMPLGAVLTGPGNITSWEIEGDLPAGLNFAMSNGMIWGIPTALQLNPVTYTIWANNSGGSTSANINITVLHKAPMFTYSADNLTLVNNTLMTTVNAINTGGYITSWEIEPAVPNGLILSPLLGSISGTPTVVQSMTMYQIWGNNSGGSHSVFINITIYDPAVDLQYYPENLTLIRDVPMTDLLPTYIGIVDDWIIVPSLPSGLTFSNGVISGTPDINMTRTTYTVWANNTGGPSSHTINITILEPMVSLDYNPENMTLVRGTQMADMTPIVSAGMVEFWSIHPALPNGLLFDTGTISGTPTVNMTTTMFTVYANNTGGNASHTINLTVLEPAGELSYANITLTRDVSMLPLSPTYSGGMVEVWSIHPALPNGLNFSNGVISGASTVNLSTTMYTVWANNSGGVSAATINITVNEPIPILSYIPNNLELTRNTTMPTLVPTLSGGYVASWGISPSLPAGLVFENGTLTGTPTLIQDQIEYTVWANNSGGSTSASINITVLDIIPEISYIPQEMTLTNNTTMTHWTPLNLGGPVVSWSISPELSPGLLFDSSNGTIYGLPTEVTPLLNYTVTATNSGGASDFSINITVVGNVPFFEYIPSDVDLLNNSSILDLLPHSTGGTVLQWAISPELSVGLSFDNATGRIYGMPSEIAHRTLYLVTGVNDDGSYSAVVNLTVEDLVYENAQGVFNTLNNSMIDAIEPLSSISDSVYEIHPALPTGLSIGNLNGTIWGVPNEVMELKSYTVYSNSSLFNDTFVIMLRVLEDSDNDSRPDVLPVGYDVFGELIEDLDDDGDGYSDLLEDECLSDSLNSSDIPGDVDGDTICDSIDDDIDGDGLFNSLEDNSGIYTSEIDTGTDPLLADTDGDGVCDGPAVPANGGCTVGPDAFPNDPSAYTDTDRDGMPDDMFGNSTSEPPLILDLDDDNDRWTDLQEAECGTDHLDRNSVPDDTDGDGICNNLDDRLDLTFEFNYSSNNLSLVVGDEIEPFLPNITGNGEVGTWEIVGELPEGLTFGWSPAREELLDGSIRGTPNEPMELTEFVIWGNNSVHSRSFSITLEVKVNLSVDGSDSTPMKLGYVLCPVLLLVLVAFAMLLVPKNKVVFNDAIPARTTSRPKFKDGAGTREDPFILKTLTDVKPGTVVYSNESITSTDVSPAKVFEVKDMHRIENEGRFKITNLHIQTSSGDEESKLVSRLNSNDDGILAYQLAFDGRDADSVLADSYETLFKVGNESVYFQWTVKIKSKSSTKKSKNSGKKSSKKSK
ncbi:MAG: hypothetical protein DWC09_03160, partial [Candidatus Poseidoniales archaeon]